MVLPTKLNDEQKELLGKLQESFGVESTPQKSIFEACFDRVKNWFE
jgi:molecular chaperone DnaJ